MDVIVTIDSKFVQPNGRKGKMNNLRRTKRMLLLTLILSALLCGCAVKAESFDVNGNSCQVEQNLQQTANVFASQISYDTAITENVFYVDELQVDGEDALGIYEKKDDSLVWYCTIPEDFNDIGVDPFDSLVYTELDFKMPDSAYESLELAKELIYEFVNSSNLITNEDKERIIDEIINLKVHFISIDENDIRHDGAIMMTHGKEIYVNSSFPAEFYTTHTFLHELVHVASNITSEGSLYENSYYNSTLVSEAITELIAREILYTAGLEDEIVEGIIYEYDFGFALAVLGRYDVLKAYFYPDVYEEILKNVDKKAFDLFYVTVHSMEYEYKLVDDLIYYIWEQISK